MNEKLRVCVVGAGGRMGSRVVEQLRAQPDTAWASALVAHGDTLSIEVPAGVVVTSDAGAALSGIDVVIDFSAPPACVEVLAALPDNCAYVVASTGLEAAQLSAIEAASKRCAVLQAANTSVGVNVLLSLVEQAAATLVERGFDTEISEIHHHHKRDAPSGTALALGTAVKSGADGLQDVFGRQGNGPPRAEDELGYAALRGGDVAGEHTVYFFGAGERIELTHRATTPDIFAKGAIVAARWLAGRGPGSYSMRDVLHLDAS